MMPPECRKLLDIYLNTARTTEDEAHYKEQIGAAIGMIGYASVRGDITPLEHAGEWTMIKLIRAQRRNKINSALGVQPE